MNLHEIWNGKGRGKKRKTSIKRSSVFQIALKGGGNESFALGNFDRLMAFNLCHAKDNIQ